ncbi:integral membrane protein [Xylariaceae sp. FL0016]|nr:integral membrane protein [Xylariaceae sp. FL0016]
MDLANPPPPPPPSLDMVDKGPTVIGIAIAFGSLTLCAISLRVWARVWLVKSFGWDDVLITIAAVFSWAFIVVIILAAIHGLGRHIGDVFPLGRENMMIWSFAVWLSSVLYNSCLGFIKLSVLALYMRLGDHNLRRVASVMMVVVACSVIANVAACIWQCIPVRAAWDLKIGPHDKYCIDISAYYLANAAINILTDILVYTLPIRLIVRLQVPHRQKIGLSIILCLGLFACISSVVRIIFIPRILRSKDRTWAYTRALNWSVIEINTGILAASIPSYKAIAKRYVPKLLGSSNTTEASGSKQSLKRRSGFQMIGSLAIGPGIDLRDLDASRERKIQFDTRIERGTVDNASEAIHLPGQIGVRTQIVTYSQGA